MPDSTLNPSRSSWKLPAKLSPVAFAFFMSGIMAVSYTHLTLPTTPYV